ncbi:MAG: hypothetical protein AB7S71_07140 [Dongiaceae bacterium]
MPVDPLLPALLALANAPGGAARPDPAPLRAQILTLPAQLLQTQAPVSLSGVVTASPIPGQLRISTPLGEVQLRVPTEMPAGRAVTIVTRQTVPTEVFLLPNGAPQANSAPPAKGSPGSTIPQPNTAPQATLPLPTSPGSPTPSATSPPANGPTANGPLPGRIAGQIAAAGAVLAPTLGAAVAPPTGTAVRTSAPPASTPVAAPPPAAPTLSPLSLLATLGIAAIPAAAAGAVYAAPPQPAQPSDLLSLLLDLRRLAGARDPRLAERLLRRLPTPDRAGALAMLALPLAAQRGALEPWFGSDIAAAVPDAPEESKGDLLQRIAAGLTNSEERIDESGERTWRWRQLPLVDQGHIIPLFIGVAQQREQPESDGGRRRRTAAIFEFAVEVALAALGRTRIGAVYQQRRLDIVVQSEVPIAQDGRERIVTAVAAVFDEFGLGGSCRFEAYRDETAAAIKV